MTAPGSDYSLDPDKIKKWEREADEADRINNDHRKKDADHQAKVKAQDQARINEAREALSAMEARKNEALEILRTGDPLQYIREAFSLLHSGDRETIDSITLAIACQSAINTQGIQPNFGGDRGTGKTSGVKAALHLVPQDYILEGSLSNKAFFHFLNSPGMIVFSDDLTINDEVTATIKRAMSNFQSSTHHRTLDKDRKRMTITIAPRTLFLFTSVSDQGDDQLRDRQFVISYANTPAANEKFLEFTRKKAIDGMEDLPLLPEVLTCRAMFEEIKNHRFRVKVPFANEIKFTDPGQRRNVIIVFDLINAFAVLRFMQRECSHTPDDPDNVITITANAQDAQDAITAYNMMGPHIQALKLSKDELALWDFIANTQEGEVTFPDLVERYAATGNPRATESKIRRLLEGRPDRGGGGLVEKIPGLTITHEIREVSDSKKRMVKVIRCTKGPGLNEYREFVSCPTDSHPRAPCPSFPVPTQRMGKKG